MFRVNVKLKEEVNPNIDLAFKIGFGCEVRCYRTRRGHMVKEDRRKEVLFRFDPILSQFGWGLNT
jgi:hypothetical protein